MDLTARRVHPLMADAIRLTAETMTTEVAPICPDVPHVHDETGRPKGAGAGTNDRPVGPAAGTGTTTVDDEWTADAGFGAAVRLAGPEPATLVPVSRSGRPVGAYLVTGTAVRYRPVVDLDQVLSAALAALTVTAVAATALANGRRRRSPAIGAVTMGPGGWVSLKGVSMPAPRSARPTGGGARRPFWARLLRAHRLVVER